MAVNNTYLNDQEAKELICEIGRNFVAANDGNISIKMNDCELWTTQTVVRFRVVIRKSGQPTACRKN